MATQPQVVSISRPKKKTAPKKSVHRPTAEQVANMSVIQQVQRTFAREHRLSAVMGFLLGGFIPVATFTIVHHEVATHPFLWAMVIGGLVYSAISVFKWAMQAFHMIAKAVGFVLLLEGVVTFAHTPWLPVAGLLVLVIINGISAAVSLQARPA